MDLHGILPLLQTNQLTGTALDIRTKWLLFVVLLLLLIAWGVGWALRRQPESTASPAIVRTFNLRVRAWLLMFGVLIASFMLGSGFTVMLFGLISFWALREFITMTPTRRGDHRTLFWTFIVFTPLQYVLVGLACYGLWAAVRSPVPKDVAYWKDFSEGCYQFFTVLIPVYASLIIPARVAWSGDPKRFLERVAKIQAGLLICVYSLSHAPAILSIDLTKVQSAYSTSSNSSGPTAQANPPAEDQPTEKVGDDVPAKQPMDVAENEPMTDAPMAPMTDVPMTPMNETPATRAPTTAGTSTKDEPPPFSNAGLLFYFILIVQVNDVLQFGWGKILGKQVIAPSINASRTWEGFIGGVLSTMLIGAMLWFVTPFLLWEAACLAGVVAAMGSAGGLVMSAIKRDRGVTDYGTLVQGHAGVLDRIDSLCFAAPIFFHLTRFMVYLHS